MIDRPSYAHSELSTIRQLVMLCLATLLDHVSFINHDKRDCLRILTTSFHTVKLSNSSNLIFLSSLTEDLCVTRDKGQNRRVTLKKQLKDKCDLRVSEKKDIANSR